MKAKGKSGHKIGYFDCFAGISGDMILAAIVDCGVAVEQIQAGLACLPIGRFKLSAQRTVKNGITATQVDVQVQDTVQERKLDEILSIVQECQVPPQIKEKALGVFRQIGSVEAKIHGVEAGTIHLHELGGEDTIVDVLGAFIGMDLLGVEEVQASPLPLGIGMINSAHGTLPLPAPATLAILEGVPVRGSDLDKELVTPTGAAILRSMAHQFGQIPAMKLLKTGYGAGKMDLPVPNVLRLLVGETLAEPQPSQGYHIEQLACLETNIDNMNPEIFPYLSERFFDKGALDVSLIPIYMKKNRPGTQVNVLCSEENVDAILEVLFSETTTLGARKYSVNRYSVERQTSLIQTEYGDVQVKFSRKGENSWDYAPEYEDCRRLAIERGIPIMKIYRAAQAAAEEYLSKRDM